MHVAMRPPAVLLLAPLLALVAAGCCTYVQHARVGSVVAVTTSSRAPWIGRERRIVPERSHLAVYGSDIVTGEHRVEFSQWDARVLEGPPMRVAVVVEMATAHSDFPAVDDVMREDVLEVGRFPRATFIGTFDATDGMLDGVMDLHGVRREIAVEGKITPRGDELEFQTDFRMSRSDFDLRAPGAWDAVFGDEVRVRVDVVAR